MKLVGLTAVLTIYLFGTFMRTIFILFFVACSLIITSSLHADECEGMPAYETFQVALKSARGQDNGGFNLDMWGTIVDRSGTVCMVTKTGDGPGDQWPGSRVISAQKANTANAFSLPGLALSTANLYSAVQPGGSLFGLQESNPIDIEVAYDGDFEDYGTDEDPLVGEKIGGVNVFGGGLPLYNEEGKLIGALGVSGDSSCADHNIAWRVRHDLSLDNVPAGVSTDKNDNIIYDIRADKSKGGFGHPECGGSEAKVAKMLAPTTTKASAGKG